MLTELAVTNLGVISDLTLVLEAGMTVLTGETGAGKTLIVDAIDLLAGGRADTSAVRDGASEAVVEGRFLSDDAETVVRRVVPAKGRSRAYVDGRMATAAELAELVAGHVDLYAQHAQHSLLHTSGQRAALDRFAGTDLGDLERARARRADLEAELASLGGDPASLEREIDLLRFQVTELDDVNVVDADEDDRLAETQELLSDVAASRLHADEALELLTGEEGALEQLGAVVGALSGATVFDEERRRLEGLVAEVDDVGAELRARAEIIEEDPDRLEAVVQRRQRLAVLRRRHGDGTLAGVIAEHRRLRERLDQLEHAGERSRELAERLAAADTEVASAAARVAACRRSAAPRLAEQVEAELRNLAMPAAEFEILVGSTDPGDDVEMRFSPNPGMAPASLARSASGGELARAMLALRLVATADQQTIVFDEVDAGIGGTAAVAVGDALARLGQDRQVFVVTHLAQVAAAADHQIGVVKTTDGDTTTTSAGALVGEDRVIELSRMLSGKPTSDSARTHARELLVAARREVRDE